MGQSQSSSSSSVASSAASNTRSDGGAFSDDVSLLEVRTPPDSPPERGMRINGQMSDWDHEAERHWETGDQWHMHRGAPTWDEIEQGIEAYAEDGDDEEVQSLPDESLPDDEAVEAVPDRCSASENRGPPTWDELEQDIKGHAEEEVEAADDREFQFQKLDWVIETYHKWECSDQWHAEGAPSWEELERDSVARAKEEQEKRGGDKEIQIVPDRRTASTTPTIPVDASTNANANLTSNTTSQGSKLCSS